MNRKSYIVANAKQYGFSKFLLFFGNLSYCELIKNIFLFFLFRNPILNSTLYTCFFKRGPKIFHTTSGTYKLQATLTSLRNQRRYCYLGNKLKENMVKREVMCFDVFLNLPCLFRSKRIIHLYTFALFVYNSAIYAYGDLAKCNTF